MTQSTEPEMRRVLGNSLDLLVAMTSLLHKSVGDSPMANWILKVFFIIIERLVLRMIGMVGGSEEVVSWGLAGGEEKLEAFFPVRFCS